MANPEHIQRLRDGAASWNQWRSENPFVCPDLSGLRLEGFDLSGYNLRKGLLENASLVGVDLVGADLSHATLNGVDLTGANLARANLTEAQLSGTIFHSAIARETTFNGCELSGALGLEKVIHLSYSYLDHTSLNRSRKLPAIFLRGCGLSDKEIAFYGGPVLQEYSSCFISYSRQDSTFVDKLYESLQYRGVRCWLDRKDVKIGEDLYDSMSKGVGKAEKLVLVLSRASISSAWVDREVKMALAEEIYRQAIIILPIAIDQSAFETTVEWARRLRQVRQIGDFKKWESPAAFEDSVQQLLEALRQS